METLAEYYAELGYGEDTWHVGPEHPYLENYALDVLAGMPRARVMEIGYQAGGFAVPVILGMQDHPDFTYTGIDDGSYVNSVDGSAIAGYLKSQQVKGCYTFHTGDAGYFLETLDWQQFDLILIDHHKLLYPREFSILINRGMISSGGYVFFHDVLAKAAWVWKECQLMCRAHGSSWQIIEEVPAGLAVVKRNARDSVGTPWSRLSGLVQLNLFLFMRMLRAVGAKIRCVTTRR